MSSEKLGMLAETMARKQLALTPPTPPAPDGQGLKYEQLMLWLQILQVSICICNLHGLACVLLHNQQID